MDVSQLAIPFKAYESNTKICVVLNHKMMKPCQFIKPVAPQAHAMTAVGVLIFSQKLNIH